MIGGPDVVAALVLGLLGAPHCATMCGGIVGLAQASFAPAPASRARVRLPVVVQAAAQAPLVVAQNAGRLATYAMGGALAGALGSVVRGAAVHRAQAGLEIVSGVVMIAAGLLLAGVLPAKASLERAGVPLWRLIEPLGRRALPLRTPAQALAFGLVWGWLPCGLVYSSLSVSIASGSAADGALTMLAFGAGTLPALLGLGAAAGALARLARVPLVRQLAGVALAAFGAYRFERGLSPSPRCPHCG